MSNVLAIESAELSNKYDKRYIIVDKESGEVLDDAQGYGYKSPQKAYSAWGYKNRDKSKDKEKQQKRDKIRKWLKDNKEFRTQLEICEYESLKTPGDIVDAKLVKSILKDLNLETEFTPSEILKVWRKYY